MNYSNSEQRQQAAKVQTASNTLTNVLAILVFLMAIWMLWTQVWPRIQFGSAQSRTITPRGDLADFEKATMAVFDTVAPSVVFIENNQVRYDRRSRQSLSLPQGSGTGFIWDTKGHIVTNLHVIAGSDSLTVTLADGLGYQAEVVGASKEYDLAVIRIGASLDVLDPIPLGTSDDLRVGQSVFAIGNPFGFDHSLTRGIISALHRDLPQNTGVVLHDVIQTDAAINPGNSGGPLLDSAGRLIGVNTAIISPSQANAGIGFAIPADLVNRVVPQLINNGKVVKPVLGVRLNADGIRFRNKQFKGLRIQIAYQGYPADKAGLLGDRRDDRGIRIPGDMLVSIDGQSIDDLDDYNTLIQNRDVGDNVIVNFLRFDADGSTTEHEIEVVLAALADGG